LVISGPFKAADPLAHRAKMCRMAFEPFDFGFVVELLDGF